GIIARSAFVRSRGTSGSAFSFTEIAQVVCGVTSVQIPSPFVSDDSARSTSAVMRRISSRTAVRTVNVCSCTGASYNRGNRGPAPMSFVCIHCRSEIDPRYKACPHCGEAVTDFLRKYLETPIDGKYQILSRLGVGGMGEVYKALHIHLNAIRVIKMMRANIAGDQGAHDRFLREARLATRISHPNVAALYDFSTLDDTARYMVCEYIEG